MIKKITDIFKEKERTFSFEFFPPKTPQGIENLYKTVEELRKLTHKLYGMPDIYAVSRYRY